MGADTILRPSVAESVSVGQRVSEQADRAIIYVVALRLPGDHGVQRMMHIVKPLGGKPVAAPGFVIDDAWVILVCLTDNRPRHLGLCGDIVGNLADFFHD